LWLFKKKAWRRISSKTGDDKWLEKTAYELSWLVHLTKNVQGDKSKMRRRVRHVAHIGEKKNAYRV
jgi:hypothetical protein